MMSKEFSGRRDLDIHCGKRQRIPIDLFQVLAITCRRDISI